MAVKLSTCSSNNFGCIGKSPIVALVIFLLTPFLLCTKLTINFIWSIGKAPRAPALGSFKSMMSAPFSNAKFASSILVTLMSNCVLMIGMIGEFMQNSPLLAPHNNFLLFQPASAKPASLAHPLFYQSLSVSN